MQAPRVSLYVCLAMLGLFNPQGAWSKSKVSLFADSNMPQTHAGSVSGDIRARVNTSALSVPQHSIDIHLPGYGLVTATMDGYENRGRGNATWRGILASRPASRVTLTVENGFVAGTVSDNGKVFKIEPAGGQNGLHSIQAVDFSKFKDPLGFDDVSAIDIDAAQGTQSETGPVLDTSGEIHLLSVYSTDAESAAGGPGQINALIQSAVDQANTAFIDSGIDARYMLVHTERVDRRGSGDLSHDLNWLRKSEEVATLRDFYGADLVSMIVEEGGCGQGYVLNNPEGAPSAGFQVTVRDCAIGNMSFAHEHGHNLGFGHNEENANTSGYDEFSHGRWVDRKFRTIMSYATSCNGQCPRVTRFSNPELEHEDVATGVHDVSDNARTALTTVPIVAGYRPSRMIKATVSVQIQDGLDDVEERMSDGYLHADGDFIELGADPDGMGDQLQGWRFVGVNVPQGATITGAWLSFSAVEATSEATNIMLVAENADSSEPFGNSDFGLSSRNLSESWVDWTVGEWSAADEVYDSADLSPIVQGVIDRSGWVEGNALTLVAFGEGTRSTSAFERDPLKAAVLTIEYMSKPSENLAPEARFDWVCNGLSCEFSDRSTDPDGSVQEWEWVAGEQAHSAGPVLSYRFPAPGTYLVELTVKDDQGASSIFSSEVTVNCAPAELLLYKRVSGVRSASCGKSSKSKLGVVRTPKLSVWGLD